MTRSKFLPAFNEALRVASQDGLIDRMSLSIGSWSISGEAESIRRSVLEAISPTDAERDSLTPQLFEAVTASSLERRIRIKTHPNPKSPMRPHYFFNGALRSNDASARTQRITFDGNLNVTRFIQAQKLAGKTTGGLILAKLPLQMATQVLPSWSKNEAYLVTDSNVIMGGNARFTYAKQVPIVDHLETAINGVVALLGERLEDAAGKNSVSFQSSLDFSIRGLEVYWEFGADDPILLVDLLIAKLTALAVSSRITSIRIKPPIVETAQLSRSVLINISADTQLRVYAKTTGRVRFEISFSPKAISRVVAQRTTSNMGTLKSRTSQMIEVATGHVNWVLSELSRAPFSGMGAATPDDLRNAIVRASPDLHTAMAIIQSLRSTGRISPDGAPAILAAVAKLKTSRVLRTVRPHMSCYRVTDRYFEALEYFRDFPSVACE